MDQIIIGHAYAELPLRPLPSIILVMSLNFAHVEYPEDATTSMEISNFQEALALIDE